MAIAIAVLLFIFGATCLFFLFKCVTGNFAPAAIVFFIGAGLTISSGVLELVALSSFVIPIGILLCLLALFMGLFGLGAYEYDEDAGWAVVLWIGSALAVSSGIYQFAALT